MFALGWKGTKAPVNLTVSHQVGGGRGGQSRTSLQSISSFCLAAPTKIKSLTEGEGLLHRWAQSQSPRNVNGEHFRNVLTPRLSCKSETAKTFGANTFVEEPRLEFGTASDSGFFVATWNFQALLAGCLEEQWVKEPKHNPSPNPNPNPNPSTSPNPNPNPYANSNPTNFPHTALQPTCYIFLTNSQDMLSEMKTSILKHQQTHNVEHFLWWLQHIVLKFLL